MEILQKIFDKTVQEHFSTSKLGAKVIQNKFEKAGIILTDKQLSIIENQFNSNNFDELNIQIDDDQIAASGHSEDELSNMFSKLTIEKHEAKDLFDGITNDLAEILPDLTKELGDFFYEKIRKSSFKQLKGHKKDLEKFKKNIAKLWGYPLDLLEIFTMISLEAGEAFNNYNRSSFHENYVNEVLTRLHARGCQIASEVINLLRNGFADGAHARWRTLHEIAVISYFIANHGQETAQKYIYHDVVESYKAALIYQKHCKALGYNPIDSLEFSQIKKEYDNVINEYGKNFKNQYGWTSHDLMKNNPNFADIEANVGLEHIRPYYKMASDNVHANPRGIFYKLGLVSDSSHMLLAGPSNLGFTGPGQNTAISLLQLTGVLLTQEPNIDRLVVCQTLMNFEKEISESFFQIQKEIDENDT